MPEMKSYPPGTFCWAEVATTDAQRAKSFYSELFGWTYQDKPAGEFGVYTFCLAQGKDLAGLYELPAQLIKAGVPPHWMPYIAVASADAACTKITKHGGTIEQGPFDVMDVGRMAICKDPTGALFSIWQPKAHKGASVMGETGTPCWFELATRGVDKAEKFYVDVFGWSVKKGGDYREFNAPGAPMPMGGMMEMMPQQGPMPPSWKIYFTVQDCDGDAQRTKALGGQVLVPPMDIPEVGRFSVLADPGGATFAIIKLEFNPEHKHEAAKATASAASTSAPSTAKSPSSKKK